MIRIEGETSIMLDVLLETIMARYGIPKEDAARLFIEAAFRCIETEHFYKTADQLLEYCLVPAEGYRCIGAASERLGAGYKGDTK